MEKDDNKNENINIMEKDDNKIKCLNILHTKTNCDNLIYDEYETNEEIIDRYVQDALINNDLYNILKFITDSLYDNINKIMDDIGNTLLHWILISYSDYKNDEIIEYILNDNENMNIDLSIKNVYGNNILLIACYNNVDIKLIKKMLDIAKDNGMCEKVINEVNNENCTLLDLVIFYTNNIDLINLLIEYGIKVKINTLFNIFDAHYSYIIIEKSINILLEYIDINELNDAYYYDDHTFMSILCNYEIINGKFDEIKLRLVNLLLKRGIDINVYKNIEKSPLYIACKKGNIDLIYILLDNNVKITYDMIETIKGIKDIHINEEIIYNIERYMIKSRTKSAIKCDMYI